MGGELAPEAGWGDWGHEFAAPSILAAAARMRFPGTLSRPMKPSPLSTLAVALFACSCVSPQANQRVDQPPVTDGLLLDLDADEDVFLQDGNRVVGWRNQVADSSAQFFVHRDLGRDVPGSGRPTLRMDAVGGHDAVVFEEQELVNMHEDEFDVLTTGQGYTWFSVMTVYAQHVGLPDVNSFFGNLRNGGNYEGFWGNVEDDNTLWIGSRNGVTFGRFDENNPKLVGPRLEIGQYYVVAGRMEAGTDTVAVELFVDSPEAVGAVPFPVNPDGNPSRMAIGQERDATNHPGVESFHGEIVRFLVFGRPLSHDEMTRTIGFLQHEYGLGPASIGRGDGPDSD